MLEIGAYEAKNKLSALLDRVEKGEEIIITRRGKTVAKIVPPTPAFDREAARAAVARMLARNDATLGGIPIRELIDEGRE
jgi:prevent-host-death family protein